MLRNPLGPMSNHDLIWPSVQSHVFQIGISGKYTTGIIHEIPAAILQFYFEFLSNYSRNFIKTHSNGSKFMVMREYYEEEMLVGFPNLQMPKNLVKSQVFDQYSHFRLTVFTL